MMAKCTSRSLASMMGMFYEAWFSIGSNRLRACLAILGIVIGVASVVLMSAIGNGSRQQVEQAIAALGTNQLVVMPGSIEKKGLRTKNTSALSLKDADILSQLSSVRAAAAATYERSFQVASGKLNWNSRVMGTVPSYFEIANWTLAEGTLFSEEDVSLAKRVAVLGTTVADKLFPEDMEWRANMIGRRITINNNSFTVVGVLASKGADFSAGDRDDAVYIPITTAKNRLWGEMFTSSIVQTIYVQAASAEVMDIAVMETTEALRMSHRLKDTEGDDFSITNLGDVTRVASDTASAMSLLLGAIASISLIVGGIGVTNIMLVTVTERTREIGIRKAIGATNRQILNQFLTEAILIASLGSVIGLVIGIGCGVAAEQWFAVRAAFSPWMMVLAVVIASGVGFASGIYPAYKASRMQPIEALRTINA
jgi:putative ABC transport system permease protein